MKIISKVLLVVLISISIIDFSFAADDPKPRLITVTGDADVRVVPDEVILTIGVETINVNLKTAKNENDKRIQEILKVAGKYKIKDKHIQTDHVSIEPRYENQYSNQRRKFIGYFVRKNIVLILRDTKKFENVLSGVLEAGANYIHGIQFRTTELRKHKDQARSLAIKAAKEKAIDLAKELGQKIGKPYAIQELQSGWWHPYGSWWGSRWRSGMAQNVVQNAGGGSSQSNDTIALGQIKINAKVTVSFELK